MQKGIRAFVDQVTCVHLLTSCSSQSCSVHLDFETCSLVVVCMRVVKCCKLRMKSQNTNELNKINSNKMSNEAFTGLEQHGGK